MLYFFKHLNAPSEDYNVSDADYMVGDDGIPPIGSLYHSSGSPELGKLVPHQVECLAGWEVSGAKGMAREGTALDLMYMHGEGEGSGVPGTLARVELTLLQQKQHQ